jgi:hypothetical protein
VIQSNGKQTTQGNAEKAKSSTSQRALHERHLPPSCASINLSNPSSNIFREHQIFRGCMSHREHDVNGRMADETHPSVATAKEIDFKFSVGPDLVAIRNVEGYVDAPELSRPENYGFVGTKELLL